MKKNRDLKEQKLVNDWNKKHQVGIDVIVTKDDGSIVPTKTRSEAWMLGACRDYLGHTAVIQLEDISGCYALDRVREAKP
jgi:hypothetical protein